MQNFTQIVQSMCTAATQVQQTNFFGHDLCRFFWSKSDEKCRMNSAVGSFLLRKVCLSLPGFQETGNSLTLFCGVLVYQISEESVKKYGQYGW